MALKVKIKGYKESKDYVVDYRRGVIFRKPNIPKEETVSVVYGDSSHWRLERRVRRVIRRDILRATRKRWREGRKAKRQFVSAVAYASQTPFTVARLRRP